MPSTIVIVQLGPTLYFHAVSYVIMARHIFVYLMQTMPTENAVLVQALVKDVPRYV